MSNATRLASDTIAGLLGATGALEVSEDQIVAFLAALGAILIKEAARYLFNRLRSKYPALWQRIKAANGKFTAKGEKQKSSQRGNDTANGEPNTKSNDPSQRSG